jgi:hypothetical protein
LTYANKAVNEAQGNLNLAVKLWGSNEYNGEYHRTEKKAQTELNEL